MIDAPSTPHLRLAPPGLDTTTGHPIAISGLRGLQFGSSEFGGSSSLVFSAGSGATHAGLVGVLNPAANR
jgi:hypothetical protein